MRGVLVSAVIVEDEWTSRGAGHCGLDRVQELRKLHGPVA
jgi:hypothetical protein